MTASVDTIVDGGRRVARSRDSGGAVRGLQKLHSKAKKHWMTTVEATSCCSGAQKRRDEAFPSLGGMMRTREVFTPTLLRPEA